eukprot:s2050_g9.t1
MWFLWSEDGKTMEGIFVSHVDDLLMGGSPVAIASLEALGKELGFGSLERGSFVYCGQRITQHEDYSISIDMKEYHENLKPAVVPVHRRRTPDAPLTPDEQKQLRALLGSLQWLGRVCRSTFGAELLASEEGLDAGHFCRGVFAEMLGYPMGKPYAEQSMDLIPLQMVTDAKDNYDKCNSDTPTYGSQKSLAFTISWLRSMLRRESTKMKWTL